jgi:hypothetical protein
MRERTFFEQDRGIMKRGVMTILAASLLLTAASGCMKKKIYPDPLPGWHSEDYSVIFGRLARVVAKNPDDAPVWVVRFGLSTERYGGELALTPPEKLLGYTGGEQVEIHGTVRPELGYPNYPGTWYEVRSIRMWEGRR